MADSAYTFYQIKISIFGLSQEEKTFCQKGTFINDETIFKSLTSIVKTRQANQWHHLPAYSCIKRGIAPGGGGVPCWRWCGSVHMPRLMQTSTIRWLCGCVSSFNNRSLWFKCTFVQSHNCPERGCVFHWNVAIPNCTKHLWKNAWSSLDKGESLACQITSPFKKR